MRVKMKKYLQLLLIIFGMTAISGCLKPHGLRVMSLFLPDHQPDGQTISWNNLKSKTLSLINESTPDLIGLQNISKSQINSLMLDIPQYTFAGDKRFSTTHSKPFNPVLYNANQLDVIARSEFRLSDSIMNAPSIVSWLKLRYLKTGHIFYLFNTSFSDSSTMASESLALLNHIRIIAGDAPVVVTSALQTQTAQAVSEKLSRNYSNAIPLKEINTSHKSSTTLESVISNHIFINSYFNAARIKKDAAPRDGVLVCNLRPVIAELSFIERQNKQPGDAGRLHEESKIRATLSHQWSQQQPSNPGDGAH